MERSECQWGVFKNTATCDNNYYESCTFVIRFQAIEDIASYHPGLLSSYENDRLAWSIFPATKVIYSQWKIKLVLISRNRSYKRKCWILKNETNQKWWSIEEEWTRVDNLWRRSNRLDLRQWCEQSHVIWQGWLHSTESYEKSD